MVSISEMNERLGKLDNWSLEGNCISKTFQFGTFKGAMDFVNKIAGVAEEKQHHPDILISFNKVRINLSTHDSQGITGKDFDVAEEIDKLRED